MFSFKKDPVKKLEKEYSKIMEEAVGVQRSGDLRAYASLMEQAEKIASQIQELKNKQ